MKIRTYLIATSVALLTSPLSAQEPGTVELGVFGQMTGFDEPTTLTDANAWGLGGFLGLFVAPNLALEAGAARSWTEDASPQRVDGTWTPLRARLVYAIPASERVYPLLGLGVVRNDYSDAVDGNDTGISGLIGLKGYVSGRVALRTDFSLDHVWSPFNEGDTYQAVVVSDHTNWTWTAGLSVDLGRGRAKDSDGDGIRDREDACPATPTMVRVDGRGCRVDADGDGVFDEDDRCAGTPAAARVNASGCRVDADGDGVFDEDDRCAATPAGARVDASGCRVDADGDGVFDEDDRCTGTPAGALVDASGCRVDADGDGVFDENDRCPNSARGSEVDTTGCPVLFEAEQTSLVLEGVTFETNSSQLTAGARIILDRVAEALVGNSDVRVRVSGHTDSTGSRAYNVSLSQGRAEAVASYLTSRGVAPSRMEARGVGPDEPLAGNDTREGRRMNRRVELERIN